MRTARAIVVGLLVLGMTCVLLAVLSYTVLVQIQTFSAHLEVSAALQPLQQTEPADGLEFKERLRTVREQLEKIDTSMAFIKYQKAVRTLKGRFDVMIREVERIPDESSSLSSLTLFVAKRMVDGEKSGVFEPFLRAREEFDESRMELEEAVWYF